MIQHLRGQVVITFIGIVALVGSLLILSNSITAIYVPQAGGTYIEGIAAAPGNLNPLYYQNQTDRDVGALIFRGLTRATESGVVVPELARSWEIGEADRSYTFELRDDVLWHDGEPFTAEDVAFTIRVLQAPTFTGRPELVDVWRNVEVDVLDALTVRFTLPDPFAPFLSYTTLGILPKHILGQEPIAQLADASFSRQPVGTGPWRIETVEPGKISFEPHPDFYGDAPMLGRVTFRFYPSTAAVYSAYERGEVLGVSRLALAGIAELSQIETLNVYSAPQAGTTMIVVNMNNPLFADPAVRKALLFGLNREALIDNVLDGQGVVAHSLYLPTHWAYNPDVPTYTYDAERARQLLEQAGWTDDNRDGVREKEDVKLQFTLLTNQENPQHVALIDSVARQWAQIGVQAEPRAVNFADLVQTYLRPRQFETVLLDSPPKPTTDPDMYPLWHSSQAVDEGLNWASWSNARVDDLLEEGERVLDHNTRRDIYGKLQRIFAEEVPSLPLFHPIYTYGVDEKVQNVQIGPITTPSDRFQTLNEWYINLKRIIVTQTPENASPE